MSSIMRVRAVAAALEAALSHGLLPHLATSPGAAEELAAAVDLDAHACSRVLEVLHAEGLLTRERGRYTVAGSVRRELLAPELIAGEAPLWAHVPAFLASGRTLDVGRRAAAYRESTPHLARRFAPSAAELAGHLAAQLEDAADPSVLDVGAGSGIWSLAILERLPRATGCGLDLEPVLPRYLERAEALGLRDRVEARAGDFHSAEPGRGHDVVVLANVVHLEAADRAARLIERWAGAVGPGGRLVVVDMLGRTGADPAHAAYALHLALRLAGARPHPEPELRRWLARAGFGCIERLVLEGDADGAGLGALIARRG